MKKQILTTILTLVLLLVTVYSATAITIDPIDDQEIYVWEEYNYSLKDIIVRNETGHVIDNYDLLNFNIEPTMITVGEEAITWNPVLGDEGEYELILTAKYDDQEYATTFNLTVLNFEFTNGCQSTGQQSPSQPIGEEYTCNVSITELPEKPENFDVNNLTITIEDAPSGVEFEIIELNDEVSAVLTWTPTFEHYFDYENLEVNLTIDYNEEKVFEDDFNLPRVEEYIFDLEVSGDCLGNNLHVGNPYDCEVSVTNLGSFDEENLRYSITGPNNININNDGEITWTPTFASLTDNEMTIIVSYNEPTAGTYEVGNLTSDLPDVGYSDFEFYEFELEGSSVTRHAVIDEDFEAQFEINVSHPNAISAYDYVVTLDGETTTRVNMNNNGLLTWTPRPSDFGEKDIEISIRPRDAPTEIESKITNFDVFVHGLIISEIEVYAKGSRLETIERDDYLEVSSPYLIDDYAKLGDTIELKITIENLLPDETEYEMRNVDIELYSYGLNDASGKREVISRIRPDGGSVTRTITFEIDPKDVDLRDAPFEIEILVDGEVRGDRVLHSDLWLLELDLDERLYDLIIVDEEVFTKKEYYPGDTITFDFLIKNIGTRDLSNGAIRFREPFLGINTLEGNIDLDSDETKRIIKQMTIPTNAEPGEYFIEVTTYPRITSSSDTRTEMFSFLVKELEEEEDEEEHEETTPPEEDDEIIVPGKPISEATGTKSKSILSNVNLYEVFLAFMVAILLVGLIILIMYVFYKK